MPREVYCDDFDFEDSGREDCIAKFVRTELVPLINGEVTIITFDGLDGVGKTTLSMLLAAEMGAQSVHLDDFVAPNKEIYLGRVDKFIDA